MISFLYWRPYMENKNYLSIKSPKEKTNIKLMKYILNDKELIQVFIFLFLQWILLKNKSSRKQIYGMLHDLGRLVSFKNLKRNTCSEVLFLVKLQMLNDTLPEVLFTFLNETNCPKSQTKVIYVKRKLYVLCILSISTFEQKIHCVRYVKTRISSIFLYKDTIVGSVIIRENTGQGKPVFLPILDHVWRVN